MEEKLHPGHRSIRLRGCDYTAIGFYFVTICTHERRPILSAIEGGAVRLFKIGELASKSWAEIPRHFAHARLHSFVVMPNHLHGIVELVAMMGRSSAAPLPGGGPAVAPGSIGAIVRSFKAVVTKRARLELGWNGEVWQRNYYEHVLRDGKDVAEASAYIAENPKRWEWDRENPQFKK